MNKDSIKLVENWINQAHTVYPFNWRIAESMLFPKACYEGTLKVSDGLQLRENLGFENFPVFLEYPNYDMSRLIDSIKPAISVWMCEDSPYTWMTDLNTTTIYDIKTLDPKYPFKFNLKLEEIKVRDKLVGYIINQGFDEEGDFSFALFSIFEWRIAKFFGSEDPINKVPFPLAEDDETKYKILKEYGHEYLGLEFNGVHSVDLCE